MAEQKFTPGPWYVRRVMPGQVREANYIDITNVPEGKLSDYPNGWLIAEIDAEHPVDEANARLIAASPTMINYIAMRASLGDNEAILIVQEVLGDAASKAIENGTTC